MPSKAAILLTILAAFAHNSAGQSTSGEITTKETPVSFTSRVSQVPVPVVVRDSKGKAVGGLQKDDFQVFDSGKPQIVSGFSMEHFGSAEAPGVSSTIAAGSSSAGANLSSAPTRSLAIVVDDLHTEFADLAWARIAAEKFLSSVPASERVALFTTSGEVVTEFTSDRDQLITKLRAIRSHTQAPIECLRITYFIET